MRCQPSARRGALSAAREDDRDHALATANHVYASVDRIEGPDVELADLRSLMEPIQRDAREHPPS
jgi:hypothetical protein